MVLLHSPSLDDHVSGRLDRSPWSRPRGDPLSGVSPPLPLFPSNPSPFFLSSLLGDSTHQTLFPYRTQRLDQEADHLKSEDRDDLNDERKPGEEFLEESRAEAAVRNRWQTEVYERWKTPTYNWQKVEADYNPDYWPERRRILEEMHPHDILKILKAELQLNHPLKLDGLKGHGSNHSDLRIIKAVLDPEGIRANFRNPYLNFGRAVGRIIRKNDPADLELSTNLEARARMLAALKESVIKGIGGLESKWRGYGCDPEVLGKIVQALLERKAPWMGEPSTGEEGPGDGETSTEGI